MMWTSFVQATECLYLRDNSVVRIYDYMPLKEIAQILERQKLMILNGVSKLAAAKHAAEAKQAEVAQRLRLRRCGVWAGSNFFLFSNVYSLLRPPKLNH